MALRSEDFAFLVKKKDKEAFVKWLKDNDFSFYVSDVTNYKDKFVIVSVEISISGQRLVAEVISKKIVELEDQKENKQNG